MTRAARRVAVVEFGDGVRAWVDLDRRRWGSRDPSVAAILRAILPADADYPPRVTEYEPDPSAPFRRAIIGAGGRIVRWPPLRQPGPGAVA